jgi:hypothetical protein
MIAQRKPNQDKGFKELPLIFSARLRRWSFKALIRNPLSAH